MPEKIISWEAPERVYIARSKEFFKNVGVVVFVVALVLALVKEFLLIGVILAFYFLAYALSTNKPGMVTHQITSEGIVTGEKEYLWEVLDSYWFAERGGFTVLHVRLKEQQLPRLLAMILDGAGKEKIEEAFEGKVRKLAIAPVSWEEKLISNISSKLAFR